MESHCSTCRRYWALCKCRWSAAANNFVDPEANRAISAEALFLKYGQHLDGCPKKKCNCGYFEAHQRVLGRPLTSEGVGL
jgi:hypothetical protein